MNKLITPDDLIFLTRQTGTYDALQASTLEVPTSRIVRFWTHSGGSDVEFYTVGKYAKSKGLFTNVPSALVAKSTLFIPITPVDADNVVGTQYWVNASLILELRSSPSNLTNANSSLLIGKTLTVERIHITETKAALRLLFDAAGASGNFVTLTTPQTITGPKTLGTNTELRFRDTTNIKSSAGNTLDVTATSALNLTSAHTTVSERLTQTAGSFEDSITSTMTAFAGGGQANAIQTTRTITRVNVVASDNDSVKLMAAVAGRKQRIYNDESVAIRGLAIFPQTGESIDSLGVDTAIVLKSSLGLWIDFQCEETGHWTSSVNLAVSNLHSRTQGGTVACADHLTIGNGKVLTADSTVAGTAIGTAGGSVTAVHHTTGKDVVTTLTLSGWTRAIAGAGNEAVGAQIYAFPAGKHTHFTTSYNLAIQGTGTVDLDTPDVGIGSVVASGAVAVLGGTPTFEDYVTGSAAADCNGTVNDVGPIAATAGVLTGISLNKTGDSKGLFLNLAANWAGADTITVSGTVTLKWTIM